MWKFVIFEELLLIDLFDAALLLHHFELIGMPVVSKVAESCGEDKKTSVFEAE
jgi:hypothetical protein